MTSAIATGRHGAAEVGYIDPTVLTGERDERLLLLAGRSWRVSAVDWSKRIVWLEPAASGGKARWMGGARSLGRDVCQGIRTVLADGAPAAVSLSRRARSALASLAAEIPLATSSDGQITTRGADGPARTWTFAGTKINRTLARQASVGASKVRFDALSVQAPIGGPTAVLPQRIDLTPGEIANLRDGIKFGDCVPNELLARTIVARQFETDPSGDARGGSKSA